jgi:hypothetical protein
LSGIVEEQAICFFADVEFSQKIFPFFINFCCVFGENDIFSKKLKFGEFWGKIVIPEF